MEDLYFDPASQVYTPSELNQEVKLHLEAGFPRVLIEAEVSNLARPASGHLYFSLKDQKAQIRCAMFRSSVSRSPLQLENGKMVLARGRISLYEARGEYQFIVDALREAGEGLLQQKFELLKKKLETEGLFEPARKKALPSYPNHIGVITSPSGAAIRDILQILERRWPLARIRLYPVSVQGAEAPGEIQAALARANREGWSEVLIVGRGGGSLEDLQAFNEESVARSVAASEIPVISAVGHETDFSICDFVADLRAPTPSAAAELATPDQTQLNLSIERSVRLLENRMRGRLQRDMQSLDHLAHRLSQRDPARSLREQRQGLAKLELALARAVHGRIRQDQLLMGGLATRLHLQHPRKKLDEYKQRIYDFNRSFQHNLGNKLTTSRQRLVELGRTLHAVSPLATLGRGFAVLSASSSGAIITSANQLESGDKINAQLSDGRLNCTVDEVTSQTLDQLD